MIKSYERKFKSLIQEIPITASFSFIMVFVSLSCKQSFPYNVCFQFLFLTRYNYITPKKQ